MNEADISSALSEEEGEIACCRVKISFLLSRHVPTTAAAAAAVAAGATTTRSVCGLH